MNTKLLLIIIFIIIIAIVIFSDELAHITILISLMASLLVIGGQIMYITRKKNTQGSLAKSTAPENLAASPTLEEQSTAPPSNSYALTHGGYAAPVDWRPKTSSADDRIMQRGLISHAKTAIDGLVTKTSHYFTPMFQEELGLSERQAWWGNLED